jgi:hypothetical protein
MGHPHPILWPSSFADPARTGLAMALAMADVWDPLQLYAH